MKKYIALVVIVSSVSTAAQAAEPLKKEIAGSIAITTLGIGITSAAIAQEKHVGQMLQRQVKDLESQIKIQSAGIKPGVYMSVANSPIPNSVFKMPTETLSPNEVLLVRDQVKSVAGPMIDGQYRFGSSLAAGVQIKLQAMVRNSLGATELKTIAEYGVTDPKTHKVSSGSIQEAIAWLEKQHAALAKNSNIKLSRIEVDYVPKYYTDPYSINILKQKLGQIENPNIAKLQGQVVAAEKNLHASNSRLTGIKIRGGGALGLLGVYGAYKSVEAARQADGAD